MERITGFAVLEISEFLLNTTDDGPNNFKNMSKEEIIDFIKSAATERYFKLKAAKYCTDIDTINITIAEVKRKANKRIKEHHEKEKEYQQLFKTECEEEKNKTIIECNRQREDLKESVFDESSLTINKIKKLGLLKTRK